MSGVMLDSKAELCQGMAESIHALRGKGFPPPSCVRYDVVCGGGKEKRWEA